MGAFSQDGDIQSGAFLALSFHLLSSAPSERILFISRRPTTGVKYTQPTLLYNQARWLLTPLSYQG